MKNVNLRLKKEKGNMTEDKVRESAGKILGFKDTDTAISGVGQITSFNQLGFIGVKLRGIVS